MEREQVEARLEKLQHEREIQASNVKKAEDVLRQQQANLFAYDGAIQECQHWLEELEKAGKP